MGDDENFDLDDDLGLDDDGSDFAGSLDDALEDGDGGDLSGGDSGDSELDSFFEDLSSIEDMDPDTGTPAPAAAPTSEAAPMAAQAPAAQVAQSQPNKAGSKGKKFLFLLFIGGIAAGIGWFFFAGEPEPPQMEDMSMVESTAVTQMLKVEQPKMGLTAPVPPVVTQLAHLEPVVGTPKSRSVVHAGARYLVQIATCSFDQCKEEYSQSVRKSGEPVYTQKVGEKFDFIELVTAEVFSYRKASQLAKFINKVNHKAGEASVAVQANGYRVTLGTFPALDRAKDLKFSLEKKLHAQKVRFNLEHVRKSYESIKVYAGPYDSRLEAKKVLKSLRKDPAYQGAFLVRF